MCVVRSIEGPEVAQLVYLATQQPLLQQGNQHFLEKDPRVARL